MKKFLVGLISIIILFSTNLHAIEKKQIVDDAEWGKKIDTLKWYNEENSKDHTIKIPGSNANIYINRTKNDNDAGWQPRGVSTITAMEIKG